MDKQIKSLAKSDGERAEIVCLNSSSVELLSPTSGSENKYTNTVDVLLKP